MLLDIRHFVAHTLSRFLKEVPTVCYLKEFLLLLHFNRLNNGSVNLPEKEGAFYRTGSTWVAVISGHEMGPNRAG